MHHLRPGCLPDGVWGAFCRVGLQVRCQYNDHTPNIAHVITSSSGSRWNNEPLMSHAVTAVRLNYPATTNTDGQKCGLMIPGTKAPCSTVWCGVRLLFERRRLSAPLVCPPASVFLHACSFGGFGRLAWLSGEEQGGRV